MSNNFKPKLFVIGNIATEIILEVERFPYRNESIKAEYFHNQIGGAGASIGVAAGILGADVFLLSKIGREENGFKALEAIKNFSIRTTYIHFDASAYSTPMKITFLDRDGNTHSVITDITSSISIFELQKAEEDIKKCDALALELGLPDEVIYRALKLAKDNNIKTFVKPSYTKHISEKWVPLIDTLILNETELSFLSQMPVRHIETAIKAMKKLQPQFKDIILNFSKGTTIYLDNGNTEIISSCSSHIVDNSIADLAFAGSYIYFTLIEKPRKEAVKLSQCVAAYTMEKRGGIRSLPNIKELHNYIDRSDDLFARPLQKKEIQELIDTARTIRRDILEMTFEAGSGHPGGSLSIVEILTLLYFHEMNIYPNNPKAAHRDRLVLSKGHAAPALYAVLARRGFFDIAELKSLRKLGSILQGHPDMKRTPGIDFSTGSLGQGFSAANGMAIGLKAQHSLAYVYAILGDGEIQEGQIWEAAMTAVHYKLDNLIVFLDYNGLQIGGTVGEVKSTIEPLAEKWEAFGWHTLEVDGHNFLELKKAINRAKQVKGKPSIIIAYTIKGKGISFMERAIDYHGKVPDKEHLKRALEELK